MKENHTERLVVIGGGAAGFFCAVNAARLNPALKVIIVEKTSKLLSKVRISGGGRCNVTHACFEVPALVKRYPRGGNMLKKIFQLFDTSDTVKWFEERHVPLKTEPDGRMFSITDSSQTIINCLMSEANRYGVEISMNREVRKIEPGGIGFQLQLNNDEQLSADFVCIATGGYPKPQMFNWLTDLGHTIEAPVPSLFTFNMPGNPITSLMGVSVGHVAVKISGSKLSETGPLLITHWGMSGPAILKLSAWGARELADRDYHFTLLVNWIPQYNEHSLRERWQDTRNQLSAQKIANRNPFDIPVRLWIYLLEQSGIKPDIRWADLPGKEQNRLIKNLTAQEFTVQGKTTFKEEFVTCGGIRLSEINPATFESRKMPGLYFAGEVLDVDGVTGGFNFQHAWTSGWIAAQSIAGKVGQLQTV
ncbi:NAD(P)/FAD-dependent oxidoreductase [Segetibacter sp. 3557_3]|nr:NAD(P)/FAD-dependent oxidoreductase [Segetibacter sp. 3557_3]